MKKIKKYTMILKKIKYIIKRGAVLCKQNSKYVSMQKLPIVYARVKNVSKLDTMGSVRILDSSTVII